MNAGVLGVDKPGGLTSHDVVSIARRTLGMRKVGHLGTLDPMATGVLPLVVGTATRLARFLPTSPKEYEGEIRLGWETTTGDREGEPLAVHPVEASREQVTAAMTSLEGAILQTPPAFSAKKLGGVAAYTLARAGRPRTPEPVPVTIERFDLVRFGDDAVAFRVVCSTGTYVRSLAVDLGRRLGTGAHLTSLRRLRAGVFRIEEAIAPDEVSPGGLRPAREVLAGLPSIVVDSAEEDAIRHGRRVPADQDAAQLCIFNKKGDLIAMADAENGWAHPKVVLL
jgi:tRNA pseudouridine55 synthase